MLGVGSPVRSLAPFAPVALLVAFGCVGEIGDVDDTSGGDGDGGLEVAAQPIHRLNRLEYDNTVRDLLGTTLHPAETFPPDSESDGFDNMASVLKLTPTLLDQYYSAARAVVDDALDDRPAYEALATPAQLTVGGGYPVGDLWALTGASASVVVTVPVDGTATITLLAGGSQIGPAPAPELRFDLDGVPVETFAVAGTAAQLETKTFAVTLAPGDHTLAFVPTNFMNDAVANTSNNVLIASVDVRSDAMVEGPGKALVYTCELESVGCPQEILERFGKRAFRRPLTPEERQWLGDLYSSILAEGETEDQAVRLVMRAVMTSPKFLYRVRTSRDADTDGFLDDFVLASRLSYFLWSSMPDERLMAVAEKGELSSEAGLRAAVEWMLDDPKAQGLVDGFAEQWLSTRGLATASPSPEVYPEFDDALRASMAAESKLFFDDFLRNGEPMSALLDADFTFIDARLAAHYGLTTRPPPGGFVRVPSSVTGRSGILTLSAWLTVQSAADHSSPIRRGRWLSDRILCQPVPPPPAGLVVQPIPFADEVSVRAALEQHRSDPQCASCHSLLDVLGMGFEEFDGIAREREEPDLDTMGELPDGTKFEGSDGLAEAVDPRTFAACTTEKLLSYSLGRPVDSTDKAYVQSVVDSVVADDATLRDVIVAIVTSPSFRSPGPFDGEASK